MCGSTTLAVKENFKSHWPIKKKMAHFLICPTQVIVSDYVWDRNQMKM